LGLFVIVSAPISFHDLGFDVFPLPLKCPVSSLDRRTAKGTYALIYRIPYLVRPVVEAPMVVDQLLFLPTASIGQRHAHIWIPKAETNTVQSMVALLRKKVL